MSFAGLLAFTMTTLITLPANSYVAQEGNISLYAGPLLNKTNFKTTASGLQAPDNTGLGLVVLGDVNSTGSLEIGLFYFSKLYLVEQRGQFLAEETNLAHITMGYRRWLSSHLALSAAFASGYSVGDVQVVHNTITDGSLVNTSARDVTEYGLDLTISGFIELKKNMSVVLDARYSHSLTAKSGEKADHFMLMLGLHQFVQEKDR